VLGCPGLEWAASGGMALTGHASGLPVLSPAPAFGLLTLVLHELAVATSAVGTVVRANPAEVVSGRAGLAGFTRRGQSRLAGPHGCCGPLLAGAP